MSKKKCYHPQSFLFYTIGDLMNAPKIDLDKNTEIVKKCVDELDQTIAKFYFGKHEEEFQKMDLGSLMSATIFTFFIMGIEKMNNGVKRSVDPSAYLRFIKERVNSSLDKLIQEQTDAKKD